MLFYSHTQRQVPKMQSWQGAPGQHGADGQHNHADPSNGSWPQDYSFSQGAEPFDPGQNWSQAIPDQQQYQHHIDAQGSANFFEAHPQQPHQNGTFLPQNAHPQQEVFQNDTNSMDFSQQFQQTSRDAIDPSFESIHPEIFAQQGKISVPGPQDQARSHVQDFQQRDYGFVQPGDHSYNAPEAQHYSQSQVLPQQTHSQSHVPIPQQFQHATSGQQHPVSHHVQARHSVIQHPQEFAQPGHYPQGTQVQFQQQQQQQQQSAAYSQAQFSPPDQLPPSQAQHAQAAASHAAPAHLHGIAAQSPQQQYVDSPVGQSASIEAPAKKRKRTVKSAPDTPSSDVISFQLDSHIDNSTAKLAEIDSLPPPLPTAEDVELINKFNKRTKAAKAKFPAIKGLPHLVYSGTITLPSSFFGPRPLL